MPANRIHLVRHGEVHNPGGVLYGRLPHFRLSERGHEMAELAAQELKSQGVKIGAVYVSPLLRTQESGAHIEKLFGLDAKTDERLIEPYNIFEGRKVGARTIAIRPHLVYHLRNPYSPSWGESYVAIVARMLEAINELAAKTEGGDLVLVTHQLPIWITHRQVEGLKLAHNPAKRRCALSSITTFEVTDNGLIEVGYVSPAESLLAVDKGAV
jgi:broad specificity phosphatase PhoE